MEMLYVIIAVVVALGLVFSVSYARKRGIISTEDLLFTIRVFDLSMRIVDELNLKQEPEIKQISNIIIMSLNKALKVMDTKDKDEFIRITKEYALEMCGQLGIQMNENRLAIIDSLIEIGFNNKYADKFRDA